MPIRIPNLLPATQVLLDENIFVMTETRAMTQDIRPLKILMLNLMPQKIATETQIARVIGNTPLQVELELLQTATHKSKHTSAEHMLAFYKTFDEVKSKKYDGMIITGAPVEHLEFEEVEYWDELCEIMEWSKTHVTSTFHICWGAQAGLYYHYGVKKHGLAKKLFGEKYVYLRTVIAAVTAPIVNTGIFVGGMLLFFFETMQGLPAMFPDAFGQFENAFQLLFLGLAGFNFLGELVVNLVLSPAIVRIIAAVKKKLKL